MPHWPPTRGDQLNQIERASIGGITSANSFRGMLFGKLDVTNVSLYSDQDRTQLVAQGAHGQVAPAGAFAAVTLTAMNGSGLTKEGGGSGPVIRVKYQAPDSDWEVWPTLATDAELLVVNVDVTRLPKSSGTTYEPQHQKAREDFVRLMRQRFPPSPGANNRIAGTRRGDIDGVWRVNSVGDYELCRLQNLEDYREWAIHHTIAMLARTINKVLPHDVQLRLIEDADGLAEAAFDETRPQVDAEQDLDSDGEMMRFQVMRG